MFALSNAREFSFSQVSYLEREEKIKLLLNLLLFGGHSKGFHIWYLEKMNIHEH